MSTSGRPPEHLYDVEARCDGGDGNPPPTPSNLCGQALSPGCPTRVERRAVGPRNLFSWLVPSAFPRRSSASERTFPVVQVTVVDRSGLLVGRFAAEP